MMLYYFTFEDTRGDITLTTYDGAAKIERCPVDKDEWHIAGISLSGWGKMGATDYDLPEADPLYPRITAYLATMRSDIDYEWDEHIRDEAADAA